MSLLHQVSRIIARYAWEYSSACRSPCFTCKKMYGNKPWLVFETSQVTISRAINNVLSLPMWCYLLPSPLQPGDLSPQWSYVSTARLYRVGGGRTLGICIAGNITGQGITCKCSPAKQTPQTTTIRMIDMTRRIMFYQLPEPYFPSE